MIVKVNKDEIVCLETSKATPATVVLLPTTRITPKAIANWERILRVVEDSEVPFLVVLDKTPNEEATKYFEKFHSLGFTDIYLMRRPPEEPIYDSQKFVTISKELWIIQLHDDDEWGGLLQIPQSANELDMFSIEFLFDKNTPKLEWESSPPARINFTMLPSKIWNHFSQFMFAQGGHVAGSMDSTLDLVSRAICNERHISQFTYVYNNRHWRKRRKATKNLQILARQDGWSFMASVDIQLINRTIDGIAAVEFFRDLIPKSSINQYRKQEFNKLSLTSKRRLLLLLIYKAIIILKLFIHALSKVCRIRRVISTLAILNQAHFKYHYLLGITKSKDKDELLNLIVALRESHNFPKLGSRFLFWEKMLISLP